MWLVLLKLPWPPDLLGGVWPRVHETQFARCIANKDHIIKLSTSLISHIHKLTTMSTNPAATNPSATVGCIHPALLTRRKERSVPLPELKEAVINFETQSRVGILGNEPNDGHGSVDARIIADDLHPLKYWQYELQSLADNSENKKKMWLIFERCTCLLFLDIIHYLVDTFSLQVQR